MFDSNIFKYISGLHSDEDGFSDLVEKAKALSIPIVTKEVAYLLKVLVKLKDYKRICEFGCGYGYSTLTMALNMPEDCKLDTVDASINSIDFVKEEIARRVEKSSSETEIKRLKNIKLYYEPALNFLEKATLEKRRYDLFFIDAVKREYRAYLDGLLQLAEPGALIIFDNVLWKGEVALPDPKKKALYLKEFNDYFMTHKDLFATTLPVGDGISLGVKL